MVLNWSSHATPLGVVTGARTPQGVCALVFALDAQSGLKDLKMRAQRRFPGVAWQRADEVFADTWRWLDAYFGADVGDGAADALPATGHQLEAIPPSAFRRTETSGSALLVSPPPLDAWGTVFQMRVWAHIARIPSGQTRSYSDLALQLGMGKQGSRAVAGACAANPVALLIPCHRVLAVDGSSSGYRWGVERKRVLLQMEMERRSGVRSDPNASLHT